MKELFRRDPDIHELIDESKFDELEVTGQTLYDVVTSEDPVKVIKRKLGLEASRCKKLQYPEIIDFILRANTQDSE